MVYTSYMTKLINPDPSFSSVSLQKDKLNSIRRVSLYLCVNYFFSLLSLAYPSVNTKCSGVIKIPILSLRELPALTATNSSE